MSVRSLGRRATEAPAERQTDAFLAETRTLAPSYHEAPHAGVDAPVAQGLYITALILCGQSSGSGAGYGAYAASIC